MCKGRQGYILSSWPSPFCILKFGILRAHVTNLNLLKWMCLKTLMKKTGTDRKLPALDISSHLLASFLWLLVNREKQVAS